MPDSFHPFPRLPIELRLEIWSCAVDFAWEAQNLQLACIFTTGLARRQSRWRKHSSPMTARFRLTLLQHLAAVNHESRDVVAKKQFDQSEYTFSHRESLHKQYKGRGISLSPRTDHAKRDTIRDMRQIIHLMQLAPAPGGNLSQDLLNAHVSNPHLRTTHLRITQLRITLESGDYCCPLIAFIDAFPNLSHVEVWVKHETAHSLLKVIEGARGLQLEDRIAGDKNYHLRKIVVFDESSGLRLCRSIQHSRVMVRMESKELEKPNGPNKLRKPKKVKANKDDTAHLRNTR